MLKFDRVVYPTDFSACSDQAFDYAALVAEQFDAELHLLHAVVLLNDDPANQDRQFPEELALLDRLESVTRSRLGQIVNKDLVAMLRVREARRRGFSPGEVILDYAREVKADLIVMGTHGRRGPSRWLLASVAEEVLRSAGCPVLTVRGREGERTLEPIGTVLVPIDFTEGSEAAVSFAKDVAAAYAAKLSLLHVVDIPAVPSLYGQAFVADVGQIETRALDELGKLAERAGLEDDAFEVAVDTGWPASAIVDHAARQHCGMIVMPARSGQPFGLLGGTTDRVVRRASCPVLTLPSVAEEQQAAQSA